MPNKPGANARRGIDRDTMNRPSKRKLPLAATLAGGLSLLLSALPTRAAEPGAAICAAGSSFTHRRLDSDDREDFCASYRGKVVLVVNTASRCAFTDQYDDLEKLYDRYRQQGLVVVGFPSNDFGNQEPGNEKSIKDFCRLTYGVQFPMYEKSVVKGEQAIPLYQALAQASGNFPRWNFHKYLLDRQGRLLDDFSSLTNPLSSRLTDAIEDALARP
jgi:glutathione peroxidase